MLVFRQRLPKKTQAKTTTRKPDPAFEVSVELVKACLSKCWESHHETKSLQELLANKTEQLKLATDKNRAMADLVAVSRKNTANSQQNNSQIEEEREFYKQGMIDAEKMIQRDMLQIKPGLILEMRNKFNLQLEQTLQKLQQSKKKYGADLKEMLYHSRVQNSFSELVRKSQAL